MRQFSFHLITCRFLKIFDRLRTAIKLLELLSKFCFLLYRRDIFSSKLKVNFNHLPTDKYFRVVNWAWRLMLMRKLCTIMEVLLIRFPPREKRNLQKYSPSKMWPTNNFHGGKLKTNKFNAFHMLLAVTSRKESVEWSPSNLSNEILSN